MECCIVQHHFLRKLQHCHHCEEVLCAAHLPKFGCMTFLHPKVECCIVRHGFFRELQLSHHCEEAPCEKSPQRLGCTRFLHPRVECCILEHGFLRKLQQSHCCEEVVCEQSLQKLEYMTFLHPKMGYRIVLRRFLRKLQLCHHCEEVLCEHSLQKLECTTFLHAKVECRIVRHRFFRKLQPSHHCEEAPCEPSLQKLGCTTFLHSKVECRIVRHGFCRELQQSHCCEEVPCENCLQNLGVWHSFIQRWNVALSELVSSASYNGPITAKKYRLRIACWNHAGGTLPPGICRRIRISWAFEARTRQTLNSHALRCTYSWPRKSVMARTTMDLLTERVSCRPSKHLSCDSWMGISYHCWLKAANWRVKTQPDDREISMEWNWLPNKSAQKISDLSWSIWSILINNDQSWSRMI